MMARSSTTSFEKVNRIGVCIIPGARARSIRTLTCHSPDFSSTEGVLTVKVPPARACLPTRRRTAREARAMSALRARAKNLFSWLMAPQRLHRLPPPRPRAKNIPPKRTWPRAPGRDGSTVRTDRSETWARQDHAEREGAARLSQSGEQGQHVDTPGRAGQTHRRRVCSRSERISLGSESMTDRAAAAISKGPPGPDPLIGRLINDRFKITALIARGGMGKVYRAEQAPLGRVCAVKVLNPNYTGEHDPDFHKRFFLEASLTSKLTHPNTVTIFDYGRTDDDIYYMAMEYLEGHTLHRAIREAGSFPEERAAHIARQICRALREAHSLGVIHRDLKPANIFLVEHGDETDFVKVLDFGLVKNVAETKGEELTKSGLFMGSPKYMAPEQIAGEKVDVRTDIYALGIIMYEMMTGKVPFDSTTSVNILMAQVKEDAIPLREMNASVRASPEMEEIIARCMSKSPDDRFRSMDEVL